MVGVIERDSLKLVDGLLLSDTGGRSVDVRRDRSHPQWCGRTHTLRRICDGRRCGWTDREQRRGLTEMRVGGLMDGDSVRLVVGDVVKPVVGNSDLWVSNVVGLVVGESVGQVGDVVGLVVGDTVGHTDGDVIGLTVGDVVGLTSGDSAQRRRRDRAHSR